MRTRERATEVVIGGRSIGPAHPVYVIAEMSANHGGRFENAAAIVRAAARAGADAIKLQTYTPDTITMDADGEPFRIRGGLWDGRRLHDLYAEAAMPWEWQPELAAIARDAGIQLLSSAFDPSAVDFLETLGVPAHKISSFELVDLPLVRKAAATGKPLILSTGMATREEIGEAVTAAREAGAAGLVLLACNSAYPAPAEEMNLRTMPAMAEAFDAVVGLSDHTLGLAVALAAVALGASVIEKHVTLSRQQPTADAAFSIEPDELEELVRGVRTVRAALGEPRYGPRASDAANLRFRRSLFVVADVEAGAPLTSENVRSIRPAGGLHPRYLDEVLGRHASKRIARGTPLSWELID